VIAGRQLDDQAGRDRNDRLVAVAAGERDHVRRTLAGCAEGMILPAREHVRAGMAQPQAARGDPHLDASVGPVGDHVGEQLAPRVGPRHLVEMSDECIEHPLPLGEIDRAAVIGIDETQVPQLASLIEVGNAGRGELEHELRQRVDHAHSRDARGQRGKGRDKRF
jgi:hypothetical protein